jgi:septum formation protein
MRIPAKMAVELPLVLASASSARAQLLLDAGFRFTVRVSDSEDRANGFDNTHALCLHKALAKARDIADSVERGIVIGADTVALLKGRVIGKPASAEEAHKILHLLSRSPHEVISGLAVVLQPEGLILAGTEVTRIFMRPMTDEEISGYIASGEAMGKAGAYAVQETGDRFVDRMEGSYSNVVGLPMELLESLLSQLTTRTGCTVHRSRPQERRA